MPKLANLAEFLESRVGQASSEVHYSTIYSVTSMGSMARLPVHDLYQAANNRVLLFINSLPLFNKQVSFRRGKLAPCNPNSNLLPCLDIDILA